ncbi:hypothetical protein [Flavobacterium foetidum]|uniref:hypothetical protein n=1 Tax=Flavobacterium foetidum TaxID=2026681 RepID=UPI001074E915|nr:hypothetical protein [Flavobacterium foetidum]KAF2513823.1 hypothetical protein E0W73_13425 [Flavobacterium foetidum]
MSKTKDFLDSLSDHELSFFVTYKLSDYMYDTQQVIKDYVQARNLSQKTIKQFVANPISHNYENAKCCPRCGSDKLLRTEVQWTQTQNKSEITWIEIDRFNEGGMVYRDEIVCNICNFCLQDPNHKKSGREKWLFWDFFSSIFD